MSDTTNTNTEQDVNKQESEQAYLLTALKFGIERLRSRHETRNVLSSRGYTRENICAIMDILPIECAFEEATLHILCSSLEGLTDTEDKNDEGVEGSEGATAPAE